MIDRQQLEAILQRRFPSAPLEQVAAAANAIMGLDRAESTGGHCGDNGHACCSRERTRRGEGGTRLARATRMSGLAVGQALRERFESIRRGELERLNKKLRGLTDDQRESVEVITADITNAIARVAEHSLSVHGSQPAVDALVRLFRL